MTGCQESSTVLLFCGRKYQDLMVVLLLLIFSLCKKRTFIW